MTVAMMDFFLFLKNETDAKHIRSTSLSKKGTAFFKDLSKRIDKKLIEDEEREYGSNLDLYFGELDSETLRRKIADAGKKSLMTIAGDWLKKRFGWSDEQYRKYAVRIAPVWETLVFQFALGVLILFPLFSLFLTLIPAMILAIGASNAVFSLVHFIVDWITGAKKVGWEYAKIAVISFIFTLPYLMAVIFPAAFFISLLGINLNLAFQVFIIIPLIVFFHSMYNRHVLKKEKTRNIYAFLGLESEKNISYRGIKKLGLCFAHVLKNTIEDKINITNKDYLYEHKLNVFISSVSSIFKNKYV